MENSIFEEKKQQLAESVGTFIKYWGFKEIHGRIWVHVYLSNNPITAKELTKTLGVTKGLVSTALSELIAYQVIEKVNIGNVKSPGYQSNTDLVQVISNILRNRELKMTTKILHNIKSLTEEMGKNDPEMFQKLNKLQDMTQFAVDSLTRLLDNKTISTNRFKTIMRLVS
ncbi:MAG: GbsR/MarR family transcriptional regulator [bacterium]